MENSFRVDISYPLRDESVKPKTEKSCFFRCISFCLTLILFASRQRYANCSPIAIGRPLKNTKNLQMKNILVAVDEPKEASLLIDQAVKIGKLTNAKIWIIHVTESTPNDFLSREAGPQYVYDKRTEERKKETAAIKQWALDVVNTHNVDAEGLIIEGPVIKSIKKIVDENGIDLIVAGHKKNDFLFNLFTTNKKKDLIDELKIPLLAVPLL